MCQFGLAHVDTPKGDLDMSNTVTGPDVIVADNSFVYPYGTTEQYPPTKNTALNVLQNTAHSYMECSNKGICDRTSGECTCLDGFTGVACQRAACANSCSGHGMCKTIESLAKYDGDNIYKLWDRKSTMGCDCDPGYGGPDCSEILCKSDIDPLYYDDTATVKYSIFNFATLTSCTSVGGVPCSLFNASTLIFTDGTTPGNNGYWAIRFYDRFGEDWLTPPIQAGAQCAEVLAALESLPNNVIPKGETLCTMGKSNSLGGISFDGGYFGLNESDYPKALGDRSRAMVFHDAFWDTIMPNQTFARGVKMANTNLAGFPSSYDPVANNVAMAGYVYRIKFFGNPGKLKEPEIEIYLDGLKPTMNSPGQTVMTHVWTDGQQGEDEDFFPNHCDGVTVTILANQLTNGKRTTYSYSTLSGMTSAEQALLKTCLGGSDDDDTNNVDVYNWDWGNYAFPHLIKLVRTTTTSTDGGYYAALVYNGDTNGKFILLNPFESLDIDDSAVGQGTDLYEVYTTTGTMALTTNTLKKFTLDAHSGSSDNVVNDAPGTTEAIFGYASNEIYMTIPLSASSVNDAEETPEKTGSVACEVRPSLPYCLNKGDLFTVLHTFPTTTLADYTGSSGTSWLLGANPKNINLYTVKKIYSKRPQWLKNDLAVGGSADTGTIGLNVIETDISTNWGNALYGGTSSSGVHPQFMIYKFVPKAASTYQYVAECSNRGLCDYSQGVCQCFPGYSDDACQQQNSLAL